MKMDCRSMPRTMMWCSAPGSSMRDLRAMIAYRLFSSIFQLFVSVISSTIPNLGNRQADRSKHCCLPRARPEPPAVANGRSQSGLLLNLNHQLSAFDHPDDTHDAILSSKEIEPLGKFLFLHVTVLTSSTAYLVDQSNPFRLKKTFASHLMS